MIDHYYKRFLRSLQLQLYFFTLKRIAMLDSQIIKLYHYKKIIILYVACHLYIPSYCALESLFISMPLPLTHEQVIKHVQLHIQNSLQNIPSLLSYPINTAFFKAKPDSFHITLLSYKRTLQKNNFKKILDAFNYVPQPTFLKLSNYITTGTLTLWPKKSRVPRALKNYEYYIVLILKGNSQLDKLHHDLIENLGLSNKLSNRMMFKPHLTLGMLYVEHELSHKDIHTLEAHLNDYNFTNHPLLKNDWLITSIRVQYQRTRPFVVPFAIPLQYASNISDRKTVARI